MKRGFKWDKKYLYWGMTAFFVVVVAILFYMALNYMAALGTVLKKLVHVFSPFIWGFVISWLLYPPMKKLEHNALLPLRAKLFKGNSKGKGLVRAISIFVVEMVMLLVITAFVYLIVPQLYQSIESIVKSSDAYISTITSWIQRMLHDYPEIEQYAMTTLNNVGGSLVEWVRSTLLPELGTLVSNLTSGVYYVLVGIYNLIIGIIASIYILSNAEGFMANTKRLLYSMFTVDNCKKILDAVRFVSNTFVGFLTGKVLDSAIIGLICYVVCALLNMPYALLVSVIVGVTNIIPFFGPFIGAVPCAIIILLVDPVKCLIFIIFIIILQQLDGNIIGPKILGNSIGIGGFWVLFSIILGGGLFVFWGMLLGVPVFMVIYTAVNAAAVKRLRRDDLPWESADYMDMDHIDPVSYEIVRKKSPELEDADEDVHETINDK